MTVTIEKDALIIGGGIAGLWLLNRLRTDGYDVMLLDQSALGSGQSIASQGMIHGGIKYALGGVLTSASNAIAGMPGHWEDCLQGEGDVDLRGTRVLSRQYYMWPRHGMRSRLTAFLGSKTLNARVNAIAKDDFPAFFRGKIKGPLYQLKDIVLDVPSLLTHLAESQRDHIGKVDWRHASFQVDADGTVGGLAIQNGEQSISIRPRRFLICSGEGSGSLIRKLVPEPDMESALQSQLRPLRMVMVKHRYSDPLYVHCIADQLTSIPEVTITTHPTKDGAWVWYLGGGLAESGVEKSSGEQIKAARAKLAELFPWCDLSNARWESIILNRAEAKQKNGLRPENVSIIPYKNILLCWPSKLSLAPNLGQQVIEHFLRANIQPGSYDNPVISPLPFPGVASTPWDAM